MLVEMSLRRKLSCGREEEVPKQCSSLKTVYEMDRQVKLLHFKKRLLDSACSGNACNSTSEVVWGCCFVCLGLRCNSVVECLPACESSGSQAFLLTAALC